MIEAMGSGSTSACVIKGKSYFWLALFIGVFGLAEPFYFFKSKEFFLIYVGHRFSIKLKRRVEILVIFFSNKEIEK